MLNKYIITGLDFLFTNFQFCIFDSFTGNCSVPQEEDYGSIFPVWVNTWNQNPTKQKMGEETQVEKNIEECNRDPIE